MRRPSAVVPLFLGPFGLLARGHQPNQGAVMVGDSTFDCDAAQRAGVPTLGVLTGGFSEQELLDAGAAAVFESPGELLSEIGRTPFAD